MLKVKKQTNLKKFWQKKRRLDENDDNDELQELEELQNRLKKLQDELFQMQRNSYRQKISPVKKKTEMSVRPEKIILTNSVDSLKRDLELMSMLSGMEVQSYVADDHCAIVYHMQHDSEHQLKHGLYIDMKSGANRVTKSSLPYGFNIKGVLDSFDNVMLPDCLRAVKRALVAYYKRMDQFEVLKKYLNIEGQLVKNLDATHIEVTFTAQNQQDPDENQPLPVTLMLDYRLYDIRPKQYAFVEIDIPKEAVESLKEQCLVLKRKPLEKAFREAFIDGAGPYLLLKQFGIPPTAGNIRSRRNKQSKTNQHYNNDDTFRPEDCSGSDEE